MIIKQSDLETMVKRINKIKGFENPKYSDIGSYVLDGAYGGVSLYKYENESGGISDVFRCGHIPKKDLYYRMDAFIIGLQDK